MKNIFFILLIVAMINGCKKYPEGGMHWNANRHLRGVQRIDEFTENGIDKMFLLKDSVFQCLSFPIYFGFGTSHSQTEGNLTLECSDGPITAFGNWSFSLRKNYLNLSVNIISFPGPPDYWEIIKLTEKQVWLRKEDEDKYYELKMSKIK